ncbi:MAG TPA: hypothetical protein VGO47_07755 [Chlamydiales bacterium]|nr:hypothetical protein [Chlamydiales bacterium]
MMHALFESLKARTTPITTEEIQVAANALPMDSPVIKKVLGSLKRNEGPLMMMFEKQLPKEVSVHPATPRQLTSCQTCKEFDPKEFERLLLRWIVACDQPFDEVEKPEFRALIRYVHGTLTLHIPSATAVKRHVMTTGEQMQEELKAFIQVHLCYKGHTWHTDVR